MAGDDNNRTQTSHRPNGSSIPDGGVSLTRPPVEQSRAYSKALKELNELDRRLPDESVQRERLVDAVGRFVSMEYHGGGYVSGLTKAVRLVYHGDVTAEEVPAVRIDRDPYGELVEWALAANDSRTDAVLSDEAFEHCLNRVELRTHLLTVVDRDGGAVGVRDEHLAELAARTARPSAIVPVVAALRDRDRPDLAREAMHRYVEAKTDASAPADALRLARDLEMTDVYLEQLRASLNRWHPDDGVERLTALVELGRDAQSYDAVLLAVKRWLRANDREPVPDEHRSLLAAAVEALLRGDRTGHHDALILYREHLYPSEHLYGIGASLFEAARVSGDDDIATDVLDAYDAESFVPGESDVETGKMAARAAEHDGRWDEAFDIWEQLLDESPSRELFERAIENRLAVLDHEAAETLIDRFDQQTASLVPEAYRVRIADERGNYRGVVDIVESNEGLFDLSPATVDRVATAYVQALADLGRWGELLEFLDGVDAIDGNVHRFYERVATLMQFAIEADDSLDGTAAVDVAERLLAAPMELEQVQLLLNLGVTRQVADRVRSAYPAATDRLDVVEGMVEILISLHAERLIDELGDRGIDTDEFERMLAETDLRRGGRQLLSTLEREARRAGITEAI